MIGVLSKGFFGLALAIIFILTTSWHKSRKLAKQTNIPVFWSPIHPRDLWPWIFLSYLAPILNHLPGRLTTPWLPLAQVWHLWPPSHTPFTSTSTNSTTFFLLHPLSPHRDRPLWTSDPLITTAFLTSYPSATLVEDMFRQLEIFGPTVATTEHAQWRFHRRVVMGGFNAATNRAVWRETVGQVREMGGLWERDGGRVRGLVKEWTCGLTLGIISRVFFRRGVGLEGRGGGEGRGGVVPRGHKMRFETALWTVLKRLEMVFLVPHALLRWAPFAALREAAMAFDEFTLYLKEMCAETRERLSEVEGRKEKSILESIILAGEDPSSAEDDPVSNFNDNERKSASVLEKAQETAKKPTRFSEADVLGNLFMLLLAGHETSGNTLAFTFHLLALHPFHQAAMYAELSSLSLSRPFEQWTLDAEYLTLQKGFLGAFLKEVMRVYSPVTYNVRAIVSEMRVRDAGGVERVIPKGTLAMMNNAAMLRDPAIWAEAKEGRGMSEEEKREVEYSPAVVEFDPYRWLGGEDDGIKSEDGKLHTPKVGPEQEAAYFPFAVGPRICPGKQFALVEMTAALATLLLEWKLELVVSDEMVAKCGGNEEKAWEETRKEGLRKMVQSVGAHITLEMRGEIPMRIVKRNEIER